jgi:hypothetical protein
MHSGSEVGGLRPPDSDAEASDERGDLARGRNGYFFQQMSPLPRGFHSR